jgi:sulfotransferase family protein
MSSQGHLRTHTVCHRPIFLIGSPRSGTSALAWSLAHHSNFWTSRECEAFFQLYGRGLVEQAFSAGRAGDSWFEEQGVSVYEFLQSLGIGISALFTGRSGGRRWVDQTPINTYMVDVWREMFPEGRFLHILREPTRVVRSMLRFGGELPEEARAQKVAAGELPPWAGDFALACRTWSECADLALDFCNRDSVRGMTVQLRDLSADPAQWFARIFAFLGERHEPSPAAFFASSRINSSFGPDRWGDPHRPTAPPDKSREELAEPSATWDEAQREIFLREIGPTLSRWELQDLEPWARTTTSRT